MISLLPTSKMRAIQIGDILDNFHKTSKLASKQAANRVTKAEALGLARWLVRDSGVPWDAQILGNHCAWGDDEFAQLLQVWAREAKRPHKFYDWMVKITYSWGDGNYTVLAAHDFKGHSVHNPLHGLMRRSKEDGTADLYAAGHRHTAADGGDENGFRGKHFRYVRVKGYKDWDEYAHVKGFDQQSEGRSAVVVVNPHSETKAGRHRVFLDLAEGAEYLQMLRSHSSQGA